MSSSATFAAAFSTLYVAHQVADHWVQTSHQAACKGQPGWIGRWNCATHVLTYTATAALALALMSAVLDLPLSLWHVTAGLVISAITHYIVDRRTPLAWMAAKLGQTEFHNLGKPRPGHGDNPNLGTGAYALDQSWHYAWLFVAALIIGAGA